MSEGKLFQRSFYWGFQSRSQSLAMIIVTIYHYNASLIPNILSLYINSHDMPMIFHIFMLFPLYIPIFFSSQLPGLFPSQSRSSWADWLSPLAPPCPAAVEETSRRCSWGQSKGSGLGLVKNVCFSNQCLNQCLNHRFDDDLGRCFYCCVSRCSKNMRDLETY